MIREALEYPSTQQHWAKTAFIGGVLQFLALFIVPGLLVEGYYLRVHRSTLAEADALAEGVTTDLEGEPPLFEDWQGLLSDGVDVVTVLLFFFIPPGALFVLGLLLLYLNVTAIATAFLALFAIVFLFVSYVVPVALVLLAERGDVQDAIDGYTIRSVVQTRQYLRAWLLAVVLFVVGAVLAIVLNVFPILGGLVGAFILFYLRVAIARLLPKTYLAIVAETDAIPGA